MRGPDIRREILAKIAATPTGLTTRQLAEAFGMDVMKVRPRVSELYKAGVIAPHPFRRQTDQNGRWRENIWLGKTS